MVLTSTESTETAERDIFSAMVSVDDHVVEPPTLWTDRLAKADHDRCPRVERMTLEEASKEILAGSYGSLKLEASSGWIDIWHYEDTKFPMMRSYAAPGLNGDVEVIPITYDDIRPGCYERDLRLVDMDADGVDVSLAFPNIFIRFCGQRFLWAEDKDLALRSLHAYNDWLTEEWAAGSNGRLHGAYILPLWDPQLAAQEVERIAAQGARVVCFSEMPTRLGMPSIYSGAWDPVWAACDANDVVVAMHIGSSSTQPTSSDDAPPLLKLVNNYTSSSLSLSDWLLSGVLDRFPKLQIACAEAQAGWIPYLVSRLDRGWERHDPYLYSESIQPTPNPPSSYLRDHVYVCIFDDPVAMDHLDVLGEDNVCFETDYPHPDGSWPNSRSVAERQTEGLTPELRDKVLRTNGLRMLGLDPS